MPISNELHKNNIAEIFDSAAAEFDSSQLDFFTPAGLRLSEIAESHLGHHVLDVGCGLGSSLLPACDRVGPNGVVVGIDIAGAMVEQLTRRIQHKKLENVSIIQMDGENPAFPSNSFDVIQAGFSFMHFPTAPAFLANYLRILRPGGRICFSELVDENGLPDIVPTDVFDILRPYFPADRPDPQSRGTNPWSSSPEQIVETLRELGFASSAVIDEVQEVDIVNGSVWSQWTMSTGLRQAWQNVPPEHLGTIRRQVSEQIEAHRDQSGRLLLPVRIRYTTARAPYMEA